MDVDTDNNNQNKRNATVPLFKPIDAESLAVSIYFVFTAL